MNSLSFAILGLLSRKPQSGYELARQLELLWAANLSQIYPLLSRLKKNEFVISERVEQIGKPDKINYFITDKGLDSLKEWIKKEPAAPIFRDEFLTKIFSIRLTDFDTAVNLLEQRKISFGETADSYEEDLLQLEKDNDINIADVKKMYFSRYILLKRRIKICQDEVEWCEWVLDLLNNQQ